MRRNAKLRLKETCGPATRAAVTCTPPARAPPPKWKAEALVVEIASTPKVAAAARDRMVDLRNIEILQGWGIGVRGIGQRSVHPFVAAFGDLVHREIKRPRS